MPTKRIRRCEWSGDDDLMIDYHDSEWGVPVHDDPTHFEYLILDAAQAGLSWRTVLHKREGYRRLFCDFDPAKVARFTKRKIESLLQDSRIIRNRLKVQSAVTNAKAFLRVQDQFDSFSDYVWRFVDGKTIHNRWTTLHEIPAETDQSRAMSKDMKQRGFAFCGPTICYAYMQAAGLVNDHETSCFRHKEVGKL